MITKKEWTIVDIAMQDILCTLRIESPNNGYMLEFDIDGYWRIFDNYNNTIKKYKIFQNAIDYILLNK